MSQEELGKGNRRRITRRGFLLYTGSLAAVSAVAVAGPGALGSARAQTVVSAGDTRPGTNAVFPADAFRHNNPGAKIIDVTKVEEALGAPAGTNATPNDPSDDDSRAFTYALNFIESELQRYDFSPERRPDLYPETSYVIYVPHGTYHVSRTISYTGPVYDRWGRVRIIGRSREGSVIKLKNTTTGFGAGAAKAVVDFPQAADFNNWPAQNVLRNLTVDTGRGNPGAIGVDFFGANNANIENVTIRSDDGQGRFGLNLPIGITSGYFRDLTVVGFNVGIQMSEYHFVNPAIEHVTLSGQQVAGVRVGDSTPTFRALRSNNSVPAVVIAGAGAHVVLLDSELTGGDPSKPAVDMPQPGHLFARNVGVSGYGVAVRKAGSTAVSGGYVGEYVSDRVYRFDANQSSRSLNLAVEDPPPTPWPTDFSRWASVDDFGARGDGTTDDAAAIQRAFDSGAEVVYFPKQLYRVESVVDVPATVRRVAFLFGSVTGSPGASFLRVSENSAAPLVVEDVNRVEGAAVLVDHAQPRTLVLNTVGSSGLYRNKSTGENGDVFFNNVNGLKAGTGTIRNQRAWARWTNTEYKGGPNFGVAGGGTFWVLGYKVEGGTINFDVQPGGTLEVLGGLANQYGADTFNDGASPDIVYRVDNGRVSAVSASNGPDIDPARNDAFITVVENTKNGVTKTVEWTELPAREGRRHQWVLPLYVG